MKFVSVYVSALCGSKYSDRKGSTGNFHTLLRRRSRTEYLAKRNDRKTAFESDAEGDIDVQESTSRSA
jgi:hypothetical protein